MKQYPETFTVHLPRTDTYEPVNFPARSNLSAHLNIGNSPILFGCRTGICGTCVCVVRVLGTGSIAPPSEEERELLQLVAPEIPNARLACRIDLTAEISIHPIDENQ